MRKLFRLVLTVLAGAILAGNVEPARARSAPNFALLDLNDVHHELYRCKGKAVVLYFTGVGCPVARKNARKFRDLRNQFESQGVEFWVVNSYAGDTSKEVRDERGKVGLWSMTVLMDPKQAVALALGVERTAEVVAIGAKDWEIFYRGAMDDQLAEGAEKPKATEHYLQDALTRFLAGEPILKSKTTPRGCRISYAKVEGEDGIPDYAATIAPLLQKNCVECHRAGSIGPWSMNSHRRAANYAEMIAEVLLTRRMPAWDPHPDYGKFQHAQSLSREDTQTLLAWVKAGAPRGEGADPLETPLGPLPDWRLGSPDAVLKLPKPEKVKATGIEPYRHIELANPFTNEVWIAALDVKPGNRKVVHHVILYAKWEGGPQDTDNGVFFVGWAPGASPLRYPKGVAKRLPAGAKLTAEMHYTTCGTEEIDQSEIAVYLADGPQPRQAETRAAIQPDLNIPPGAEEAGHVAAYAFTKPARIYGLFPHMHFRGKWMRYELLKPNGERETLLHVPRYDFKWQLSYYPETPHEAPAGSWLVVTGAFDNSAGNPANPDAKRRVVFGEQSWDEMFIGFFEAADEPASAETAANN